MATVWKSVAGSSYLELGIDWNSSQSETAVTIAQRVYRWDRYNTDNSGGEWSETLTLPNSSTQTWSGLSFGSGSGTRQIDSFSPRTYNRTHSAYNITHRIDYSNIGTWYSGSFHSLGSGTLTWTLTVPAKSSWTVSYDANGGSGTIGSQTKWYGESLTLASSGMTSTYYTLGGWATSQDGPKAYDLGEAYTANSAAALYAYWIIDVPADITAASAARNSDTSATVSWTPGTGYATTYARVYVERSTDGGAYQVIGYTAGTATSYNDLTVTANHAYTYRVRAWNDGNGGQYSSYASTSAVYNTPAAPTDVYGARTGGGSDVLLTVENSGTLTATGFDVEYSADGSTWASATVQSSVGTPVTSITIANMGGAYYFRVRNTRSTLKSAWAVSNLVITITPPAAPTLISPTSGQTIGTSAATKSVTMEFQHNPLDGSAQTAAQVRYKEASAANWTTQTLTTQDSYTATLAEGKTYVWQARTKGADANYGPWSGTQTFNVYAFPTATISSPSGTIIGMPINYQIDYLDTRGTFAGGTLKISLGGTVLYSEPLPATATTIGTSSPIVGTITTDEFLPSSGNAYTFDVAVRSSDTLTASDSASVAVSMGEPYHGTLDIQNDPETGYVSLTVGWDSATGAVAAISATLYRITEWGRVLLGDNLQDGAGIVDMYAPINTPYKYEVVTHATSTAIYTVQFDNTLQTTRFFVYFGGRIAWAKWQPSGNWSLTRPEKKRVHYAGRKWPLSYDTNAQDEKHSIGWTVIDAEGWSNGFAELMDAGGRGIYKSADGKVFHADFEMTATPNYTAPQKIGTVALTITRIDGEVL